MNCYRTFNVTKIIEEKTSIKSFETLLFINMSEHLKGCSGFPFPLLSKAEIMYKFHCFYFIFSQASDLLKFGVIDFIK